MEEKWTNEAKKLDSNAKIITSTSRAIEMIHEKLHGDGRPMNITELYESFKRTIPNAVLRKAIDSMVERGESYKRGSGSPPDMLKVRQGNSASATAYYCFEEDPRTPYEQNETISEIQNVKADIEMVEKSVEKLQKDKKDLESQPLTSDLDGILKELENDIEALRTDNLEMRKKIVDDKGTCACH